MPLESTMSPVARGTHPLHARRWQVVCRSVDGAPQALQGCRCGRGRTQTSGLLGDLNRFWLLVWRCHGGAGYLQRLLVGLGPHPIEGPPHCWLLHEALLDRRLPGKSSSISPISTVRTPKQAAPTSLPRRGPAPAPAAVCPGATARGTLKPGRGGEGEGVAHA